MDNINTAPSVQIITDSSKQGTTVIMLQGEPREIRNALELNL